MPEPSHLESHVLALIWRWQPTTAYFVRKALERSLASTFSGSPGSIYAIVDRLRRRGLIETKPNEEDGRGTELLSCSESGVAAVKGWVVRIEPADHLPEDPWRTRVAFADAIGDEDRLRWLLELRSTAELQRATIADRRSLTDDEFQLAAIENARMLNDARLAWIDRIIANSISSRDPSR